MAIGAKLGKLSILVNASLNSLAYVTLSNATEQAQSSAGSLTKHGQGNIGTPGHYVLLGCRGCALAPFVRLNLKVTTMTAITYESLMASVGTLAAAEKITKAKLRELSRDMLAYLIQDDNADVRPINALLGKDDNGDFILTPINWRIAVQYFHHFVAFTSNYDDVKEYAVKGKGKRTPLVFNKKSKKRWDKCVQLINEWLEDGDNDIWVWSNNAEMDAKPVDYAKKVQQAVKSAMDEGKGNMGIAEVLGAIAELEDVSIYDLMSAMEGMGVPHVEAEQGQEAA